MFAEAVDVLLAMVPNPTNRSALITRLGNALEVTPERIEHFLQMYKPSVEVGETQVVVGRVSLQKLPTRQQKCVRLYPPPPPRAHTPTKNNSHLSSR